MRHMMNHFEIEVKLELLRLGIRQNAAARDLDIDQTRLNRLLNGWLLPTLDEVERIGAYLREQGASLEVLSLIEKGRTARTGGQK